MICKPRTANSYYWDHDGIISCLLYRMKVVTNVLLFQLSLDEDSNQDLPVASNTNRVLVSVSI